jgi:carbonic anhydrase/acetyltransferase-like protein (isoleucine patch superfamily)
MVDPRIIEHHDVLPTFGPGVFVADTARIIGDVICGEDCSFWFGTVIRGDVFHIRIGHRVNLQDHTVVHVTANKHPTILHDDITVGHRATLHGCTIESGALIGMGATVMDEAVVGRGAMVAAGALVPPGMEIPPNTLAVGAPARVRRPLNDAEQRWLETSAAHYCDLARTYTERGYGAMEVRG